MQLEIFNSAIIILLTHLIVLFLIWKYKHRTASLKKYLLQFYTFIKNLLSIK